jgi:hypothetical protein
LFLKRFFSTKKPEPYHVTVQEHEIRIDTKSATWKYIDRWAQESIEKLRLKNDAPTNTETQTAIIRGKIKMIKEVLDLPKEKKGILSHE